MGDTCDGRRTAVAAVPTAAFVPACVCAQAHRMAEGERCVKKISTKEAYSIKLPLYVKAVFNDFQTISQKLGVGFSFIGVGLSFV